MHSLRFFLMYSQTDISENVMTSVLCAMQAHFNAQQQADEFVVESLLSHDKLNVLIRELLTTEVISHDRTGALERSITWLHATLFVLKDVSLSSLWC